MVHLHSLLFFPLLALATTGWSYRTQGRYGNPSGPNADPYPPAGSVVDEHVPQGPQEAEYPIGISSTCGQGYVAEPGISAVTTKNLTWAPLLRDITLGLTGIDAIKTANIRVRSDAKNIQPDGATIDVDTWGDTTLYWGDADYIAWGDCASTLEHGTLDTYREGVWSKKVKFSEFYDAPPTVVVFFYYLDLGTTGDAWRVKAYTEDVTTTGFTIGANTWSTSRIYAVGVSWIAVPATSSRFRAGSYSTAELHDWQQPAQKHSKSLAFSSPIRDNPTVFTGLNFIDMYNVENLRIKLAQASISAQGFTWHIDSWAYSKINKASASYLAY